MHGSSPAALAFKWTLASEYGVELVSFIRLPNAKKSNSIPHGLVSRGVLASCRKKKLGAVGAPGCPSPGLSSHAWITTSQAHNTSVRSGFIIACTYIIDVCVCAVLCAIMHARVPFPGFMRPPIPFHAHHQRPPCNCCKHAAHDDWQARKKHPAKAPEQAHTSRSTYRIVYISAEINPPLAALEACQNNNHA